MVRNKSGLLLLGVAVIVVVTALSYPTSAGGSVGPSVLSSTPPVNRSPAQPQPDWNVRAIRACAFRYRGDEDFNTYFTCVCLVRGAQTPGEEVSAYAQCQQALGY